MRKLFIAASAAAAALYAPVALAQQSLTVGIEPQLTGNKVSSPYVAVANDFGPVVGSLTMRTTLPKGGTHISSEIVGGVTYTLPVDFYGAVPYVTGELGLVSGSKNNFLAGVEVGATGPVSGLLTWDAAVRYRDSKAGDTTRFRAGFNYPVAEDLSANFSLMHWKENHKNSDGFGIGLTKTF